MDSLSVDVRCRYPCRSSDGGLDAVLAQICDIRIDCMGLARARFPGEEHVGAGFEDVECLRLRHVGVVYYTPPQENIKTKNPPQRRVFKNTLLSNRYKKDKSADKSKVFGELDLLSHTSLPISFFPKRVHHECRRDEKYNKETHTKDCIPVKKD